MKQLCSAVIAALALAAWTAAPAQELHGQALVDALRAGGYVIVMRHASSPRERPDAETAAPGNVDRERQLDENGRADASAMGRALKRLAIPIGTLLSSPTFRAMETARLLDIGEVEAVPELGDGGQGMQQDSEGIRSAWLRMKAAEPPAAGTNRLMITHVPNLVGAFGNAADGIADGESLIFKPEGGKAVVVASVKVDDWGTLVSD